MISRFTLSLFFTFLIGYSLLAQSSYAPLNEDYYHLIDRYEIKGGELTPYFFTAFKAYNRESIALFADSVLHNTPNLSEQDRFNLEYLINDNWEWVDSSTNESRKPFLQHFYKAKSDLYYVREKSFDLHINPVIQWSGGVETGSEVNTFTNTRGVEIRGVVDNKVGFYSYIGENQMTLPLYAREYGASRRIVPHEGFWKSFGDNGVDFFTARGYITFNATKHINLQFGHDRLAIGNGQRSLILSDFAPAYLFLKTSVDVWKLNYNVVFADLTADVSGTSTGLAGFRLFPVKYMATHHLGINIGKRLNIGVFESVIFDRQDTLGNNSGFDVRYLNPIIFYRAIEQQNGSADNVLLGLDFKWLASKGISIYGQLTLDEFLLENLREGNGWWANKFAVQIGGEYVDVLGINNLDLQIEANIARPYIYSHGSRYSNYSHYRQPLAHPLGANFNEVVGILRYQPIPRLSLSTKLIYADYGTDGAGENWGGNILLNSSTREMDFGNEIGQGVGNQLLFTDLTATYMWKHNFFFDLKHIYRNNVSDLVENDQETHFTSLGVRWNIPQRLHEF